jgi:hypothetical protein
MDEREMNVLLIVGMVALLWYFTKGPGMTGAGVAQQVTSPAYVTTPPVLMGAC